MTIHCGDLKNDMIFKVVRSISHLERVASSLSQMASVKPTEKNKHPLLVLVFLPVQVEGQVAPRRTPPEHNLSRHQTLNCAESR